MRLDRNSGRGKYALIKVRKLDEFSTPGTAGYLNHASIGIALNLLERHGILDWGDTPETEFFVMRLKDKYAAKGLAAYGEAAMEDDREYGGDVLDLAMRAGSNHPNSKIPD